MRKRSAIALITVSALVACGLSLSLYRFCIGPRGHGRALYDESRPVPGYVIYQRDLMWKRYALVFGVTSVLGGAALASVWLGLKGPFPTQTLLAVAIGSLALQSSYVFILLPFHFSPFLLFVVFWPPACKRMLHYAICLSYYAALIASFWVFLDDWFENYVP